MVLRERDASAALVTKGDNIHGAKVSDESLMEIVKFPAVTVTVQVKFVETYAVALVIALLASLQTWTRPMYV